MEYKVSDILRDVRVILDQNSISDQLLKTDDIDTLSLNELIESKIEDAARFVLTVAPMHLIGRGKPYEDISVAWETARGIGSGYVLLPDDFLRLVVFQMSDWHYPVSSVITEDSPLYTRQHSKYGGVRGNPQRPVVALVNHPAGLILEFFSCTQGQDVYVKSMRYIPVPRIKKEVGCRELPPKEPIEQPNEAIEPPTEQPTIPKKEYESVQIGVIDIPEKLYDAVKYHIAYLTAAALEMNSAATLAELTKTYLQ